MEEANEPGADGLDLDTGGEETTPVPDPDLGEEAESVADPEPTDAGDVTEERAATPAGSQSTMSVTVDQMEAGYALYAGTMINNYGTESESRIERLSAEHFPLQLSYEQLQHHLRWSVRDSGQVGQLAEALGKWHLAVLVGERELGKGTIALQVGQDLLSGGKGVGEVLVNQAIQQTVRVNFFRLASRSAWVRGKILILGEAFDSENRDLLTFFDDLDDGRLGVLRDDLVRAECYLLLTAELSEKLPARIARLRGLGVLHDLLPPPVGLLEEGLFRHVERRFGPRERAGEGEATPVYELVDSQSREIAQRLRTLPRVATFVEEHLVAVAIEKLPLDDAIARLDDLSYWLLDQLADDVEAWSFTVALALACAAPRAREVPWLQFYPFWRQVARFLDRELRRTRLEASPRGIGADEELLLRARAEVIASAFPDGSVVRFVDTSYPERLWQVLLGPGRGLTSLLVPLLERLRDESDYYLREAAGRALGRIGRLDPAYLILPAIREAVAASEPARHVALGKVLQGVLACDDPRFISATLEWLNRAAADGKKDRAPWIRAVCLREIGVFDLRLALTELRRMIVETEIELAILELAAADRDLGAQGRGIRNIAGTNARTSRKLAYLHQREMLRVTRALLSGPRQHVLKAVEYALVGLGFALDPIRVLRELVAWRLDPSHDLGAVLALIFLDGEGIAEKLQRNKVVLWSEAGGEAQGVPPRCGRILFAATLDDDARGDLCEFLEMVFSSLDGLTSTLRRLLRHNFDQILVGWAREAQQVGGELLQTTVEELLGSLLDSRNPDLREQIFNLLQRNRIFAAENSGLRGMALRVLERRPEE